ncbi:MAG: enolase C-terminal domain-like protein [Opitutaceae bacterium]
MIPVSVKSAELLRVALRSRLPFRYGIVTMVEVPHVFLRLKVETPFGVSEGLVADHLPPKWFTKDPSRDIPSEIEDMMAVICHAATTAATLPAAEPFRFWTELKGRQAEWAKQHQHPPLLAQFGTSMVERAILEAVASAARSTVSKLVREERLGIHLGDVHPELRTLRASSLLPEHPLASIVCRHTVGLLDPLTDLDISPEARVDDGLPQSLEASIRAYGLFHFKLKVDGNQPDAALARLKAIFAVLVRQVDRRLAFTIDGNESFSSAEAFRTFWKRVEADATLREVLPGLLFVEQPLARAVALDPALGDLTGWKDRPPIIIDESDAEPADLRQALALGYSGTSHKNCKGLFKGIAHASLIRHRSAGRATPLLQSGEDLSNIGPVAVQQDLAAQALLGIESVERNGHHYFPGLSLWPPEIQDVALGAHPDLYHRSRLGWPTLRIASGRISTQSVLAAPFGIGGRLPLEKIAGEWTTLA